MVRNIKRSRIAFDTLAQLFFPKFCYSCRKLLPDPSSPICVCPDCLAKLQEPSKQQRDVYSLFKFNDTAQTLIHQLKYRNKKKLAGQLCSFCAERIQENILPWDVAGIIPVPLFRTRFNERSYNQSEKIGKALAQILDIPLYTKVCKRVRYTKSQAKLNKAGRQQNLIDAFWGNPQKHFGEKNLLIVDDVLTTGATLKNLTIALSKITNGKIYGFTIATADEK